jgi:hypothetical protein
MKNFFKVISQKFLTKKNYNTPFIGSNDLNRQKDIEYILGKSPFLFKRKREYVANLLVELMKESKDKNKELIESKDEVVELMKESKEKNEELMNNVLKSKDEVIQTRKEMERIKEKLNTSDNELKNINLIYLTKENNFNIRGCFEFIRSDILRDGPSGNWKESWDKSLIKLQNDEIFVELLKSYSDSEKVSFPSLTKDLGGLYHKGSLINLFI